jgi:hypothetical protein
MAKKKWQKETYKLPKNHGWTAKPGYTIFVAGRGAVRFNIPEAWVIAPDERGSIEFRDREPPNDDCLLEMSFIRVHPGIDLTGVPLGQLLVDLLKHDRRNVRWSAEVFEIRRARLEVAWTQADFEDETRDGRPARFRWLLARSANIVPFITMDYGIDDIPRFEPVWDEVLASLRVAEYVTKLTGNDPRHWAVGTDRPPPERESRN